MKGYTRYTGRKKNKAGKVIGVISVIIILAALWVIADLSGFSPGDFVMGLFKTEETTAPTTTAPTTAPTTAATTAPTTQPPTTQPPPRGSDEIKAAYYGARGVDAEDALEFAARIKGLGYNGVVIDLKDETGNILYACEDELVQDMGTVAAGAFDLKETIDLLRDEGMYVITRIHCFNDDIAPRVSREMAVCVSPGVLWIDANNTRWMSAYSREAWEYIAVMVRDAINAGADEIQLYGAHFPTRGKLDMISYGSTDGRTKQEAISGFVGYIKNFTENSRAVLSLAIPAQSIADANFAENSGLSVGLCAELDADVLCPVLFPSAFPTESRYSSGTTLLDNLYRTPDTDPGGVVADAMSVIMPVLKGRSVRPYVQAFTASYLGSGSYITYGEEEINLQLDAISSGGANGFIIYNGDGAYY